MGIFTIKLKDQKHRKFFLQLLSQVEFLEIGEVEIEKVSQAAAEHDLFSSAGIWSDFNIDAKELRSTVWKKQAVFNPRKSLSPHHSFFWQSSLSSFLSCLSKSPFLLPQQNLRFLVKNS